MEGTKITGDTLPLKISTNNSSVSVIISTQLLKSVYIMFIFLEFCLKLELFLENGYEKHSVKKTVKQSSSK